MSTSQKPVHKALKTFAHLSSRSVYVLQKEGLKGFYARTKRKILPPKVLQAEWSKTYASEAFMLAQWLDCTPEHIERSKEQMERYAEGLAITSINWYLPHFEHAYYGGVYTILRFASYFAQHYQVQSNFIILGSPESPAAEEYAKRVSTVFPALASGKAVVIRSDNDLASVPQVDACVATFWSTAYYVLKNQSTKRKFYFLQDFEPMFYPAGSSSAQVEATYRFGFYGLTNTISLKELYEEQFDGRATFFNPCVDTSIFHPPQQRDWGGEHRPYTVFFYARPNFFRNGFELGSIALRKVKEQLGQRVRILSAGQNWNPADYGLEGVVENLGLLSYQQTAELYRTCDVGLAMMFTKHPSYLPFEFMASGCMVVSNVNSATKWLLKDGENCLLTNATASCISETIVRGLQDHDLRKQIADHAAGLIQTQFSQWDSQMEKVYQYMCSDMR